LKISRLGWRDFSPCIES